MSKWHKVKAADRQRIRCMRCGDPADVCEHAEWNTGNTTGVSFWYLCLKHGIEQGFSKGKQNANAAG